MSKPKLKTRREQQGLSLAAMAAKIGCSPSFLSRLENDRNGRTIDAALADKVGEAYGVRLRFGVGKVVTR